MDVLVTIESCIELCLAPCSQYPNQFIVVKSLSIYIIMEKTSFRNRQIFVNFIAIISIGAYESNQDLRGDPLSNKLMPMNSSIHNCKSLWLLYRDCFCFFLNSSCNNISCLVLKLLISVVYFKYNPNP